MFDLQSTSSNAPDELIALLKDYQKAINDKEARIEGRSYRAAILSMPPIVALSDNDAQSVIVELAQRTEFRQLYQNLSKPAAVGVVILMLTADAERGFSAVNRINTQLRNQMKASALQHLLTIEVEGPRLIYMDFECAVDFWAQLKSRRIYVAK